MRTPPTPLIAAITVLATLSTPALANPADALFDWITITDAGNAGYDRPTINSRLTGRGSVAYDYRIAREEVTTQQFLTFINTFATQSDELGARIRPPVHWGAQRDFAYSGPGVRYTLRTDVADAGRLPTLGVSWQDAAYFVNWLNNDLSTDASAIENGAYDASTFDDDPAGGYTDQSARNPDARYFFSTWDESLKAFHYDPNKNGPGEGGWWIYNNGSDERPVGGPPGVGETSARWIDDQFGGRPAWDTPLGSYPETMTPWGLLDASGGGGEWTETWTDSGIPGVNMGRYWMGAPAGTLSNSDDATYSGGDWPNIRGRMTSFRIAAVVPSPIGPTILVVAGMISCRRKR